MDIIAIIVRFLTGSRTLSLAVQIIMLAGRAFDKGIKDSLGEIVDFIFDKLPEKYTDPDGPIKKSELNDAVEHARKTTEAVYKLLHK